MRNQSDAAQTNPGVIASGVNHPSRMLNRMSGGSVRGVAAYDFSATCRAVSVFREFSDLRESVIAAYVLLAGDRNANRQQWKKNRRMDKTQQPQSRFVRHCLAEMGVVCSISTDWFLRGLPQLAQ